LARLPGQVATGTQMEMAQHRQRLGAKSVLLEAGTEQLGATAADRHAPRMPDRNVCVACGKWPNIGACGRCSALVCDQCHAPDHCARCSFEVVQEVLTGRRVPGPSPAEAKMLRILLSEGDIKIDVGRIELLWAGRRRPFHYFAVLAPFVVGDLLDRAKLACLEGPTVAALPKTPLPRFEPTPKVVDLCVWFLPDDEALRILFRRRAELPVAPLPVPINGPFMLPEPLPPWSPSPPAFREEVPPRKCPHCQQSARRFRDLGEALVCLTCGRSFAPQP
jgi:hypothetical protein